MSFEWKSLLVCIVLFLFIVAVTVAEARLPRVEFLELMKVAALLLDWWFRP